MNEASVLRASGPDVTSNFRDAGALPLVAETSGSLGDPGWLREDKKGAVSGSIACSLNQTREACGCQCGKGLCGTTVLVTPALLRV